MQPLKLSVTGILETEEVPPTRSLSKMIALSGINADVAIPSIIITDALWNKAHTINI